MKGIHSKDNAGRKLEAQILEAERVEEDEEQKIINKFNKLIENELNASRPDHVLTWVSGLREYLVLREMIKKAGKK